MQNFFYEFLVAFRHEIELEPQQRMALRVGQLTLDLQAVVGALSQ